MRALLLLAVMAGRAAPAAAWEKEKHLYEDVFTPFFVLDPQAGLYRAQREGMDPETFAAHKSTDAFRVFLIGATTVHTFKGSRDLQSALERVLPGRRVEVLRCGLSGYDSFRETIVLKEILDYAPDLVVLMGGINELQSLYYPLPPWILEVKDLYSSREWRPKLDRWLKENPGASDQTWPALREGRLAVFKDNLKNEIRLAKARGARVAVCSPPINYRDTAPDAPLPWKDAAFTKGWVPFLRGRFAEARRIWSAALPGARDLKPLTLFYLGRCAEKLGAAEEARRRYSEAIAAAAFRFCSPRCEAMMRKTAEEEGALWIDLDAAFRRAAAPGTPGLDMFIDQNQWTAAMAGLVSLELVDSFRKDAALRSLPWDAARLEALRGEWRSPPAQEAAMPPPIEATLHYALWELDWRKEPGRLFWPSLTWLEAGFELRPDWFKDTGDLFKRLESRDQRRPAGEKDDERAVQQAKFKAQLYWHVGEVRLRRGDFKGARDDFARALDADPSLSPVLASRALAEALAGDASAAARTLAEGEKKGLAAEARSLREALALPR